MACESSILQQLRDLAAICVKSDSTEIYYPNTGRQPEPVLQRRLREITFSTLFSHLAGPLGTASGFSQTTTETLTPLQQLLAVIYKMRLHRDYDRAACLEDCIDRLKEVAGKDGVLSEDVKSMIQLLLSLAGSDERRIEKRPIFRIPQKCVTRQKLRKLRLNLPSGPPVYGDSNYRCVDDLQYMQYPRELLQNGSDSAAPKFDSALFKAKVGLDLKRREPPNFCFNLRKTGSSPPSVMPKLLLGSQAESCTSDANIALAVPSMDTNKQLTLKTSKFYCQRSSEEKTKFFEPDEGFAQLSTPSSDTDVATEYEKCGVVPKNIWERALDYIPSDHYTWETIGCRPGPTEKKYMTEAGPKIVDELYRRQIRDEAILCRNVEIPAIREISERQLVADLVNLMCGIESETFRLDTEQQKFCIAPGLYISGIDPECLTDMLSDSAECGTFFYRLIDWSKPPVMNSSYTQGLVYQSFLSGLRNYLRQYQACILAVPLTKTLLEVVYLFQPLRAQIRYLSHLCMIETYASAASSAAFPTGISLLSYLYNEALHHASSSLYPVLLSLLQISCKPYLCFIRDWVFHGTCRDDYGEFMMNVSDIFVNAKDERFWKKAFTMATKPDASVPSFLRDLAEEMYVCGKTVYLMRLNCPEHYICNLGNLPPALTITFSSAELSTTVAKCELYSSRVTSLAEERILRDEAKLAQVKEDRRKVSHEVRLQYMNDYNKMQDQQEQKRKAEDAAKRQRLEEIREQMEEQKERKTRIKQREADEDADRVRKATKQEAEKAEDEADLERKVRSELIEYYAVISEKMEAREQLAIWKTQRYRLTAKRNQFLQAEDDTLQQEMAKLRRTEATSKSSSDDSVSAAFGRSATESKVDVVEDLAKSNTDASAVSEDTTDTHVTEKLVDVALPSTVAGLSSDQAVGNLLDFSVDPQISSQLLLPEEKSSNVSMTCDDLLIDFSVDKLEIASKSEPSVDEIIYIGKKVDFENATEFNGKVAQPEPVEEKLSDLTFGEVNPEEEQQKGRASAEAPSLRQKLTKSPLGGAFTNLMDLSITKLPKWETKVLPSSTDVVRKIEKKSTDSISRTEIDILDEPIITLPDDATEKSESGTNLIAKSAGSEISVISQPDSAAQTVASEVNALTSKDSNTEIITVFDDALETPVLEEQSIVSKASASVSDDRSEKRQSLPSDAAAAFDNGAKTLEAEKTMIVAKEHTAGMPISVSDLLRNSLSPTCVRVVESVDPIEKQNSGVSVSAKKAHVSDMSEGSMVFIPRKKKTFSQISDTTWEPGSALKQRSGLLKVTSLAPHMEQPKLLGSGRCLSEQEDDSTDLGISAQNDDDRNEVQTVNAKVPFISEAVDNDSADGRAVPDMLMDTEAYSTHIVRERNVHGHASDATVQDLLRTREVLGNDIAIRRVRSAREQRVQMRFDELSEATRERKAHGSHSSDSTVQRYLGGDRELKSAPLDVSTIDEGWLERRYHWEEIKPESYTSDYERLSPRLKGRPSGDVMATVRDSVRNLSVDLAVSSDGSDVDACDYLPLPVLLERCITVPLQTHVSLVNAAVLRYFMVELDLAENFAALRRFLLLEDGEFGQMLSDLLFDKIAVCSNPAEFFTPLVLQPLLNEALRSSLYGESPHADKVSFMLKRVPAKLFPTAIDTFDCLELHYKVDWPLNIVITESNMSAYNSILAFMLRLKRTIWVLNDVWHNLKACSAVTDIGESSQFRKLQLYRHEMQHFVRAIQGYIANQVVYVSWQEFQTELEQQVCNLDDLRRCHTQYLRKAVLRCLLNKKASPVVKIINDIFHVILEFHEQVLSYSWRWNEEAEELQHPLFPRIVTSYENFQRYSTFLFKLLHKLASRGYETHLKILLNILNLNDYYSAQTES